jgi:hypothetical protein
MSDQETIVLPDDEAWSRAAATGEMVVLEALLKKMQRRVARGADGWDVMALGFGAFKGTLEYLLTTSRPEGRDKLERVLLDTVRGICRGAECPIGEDGTPFEGPFV